jgi:hypothetical protein
MNAIDRGQVGHERRLADGPPRPNVAMRCSVFGCRLVGRRCDSDQSVRAPSPSHWRASAERRIGTPSSANASRLCSREFAPLPARVSRRARRPSEPYWTRVLGAGSVVAARNPTGRSGAVAAWTRASDDGGLGKQSDCSDVWRAREPHDPPFQSDGEAAAAACRVGTPRDSTRTVRGRKPPPNPNQGCDDTLPAETHSSPLDHDDGTKNCLTRKRGLDMSRVPAPEAAMTGALGVRRRSGRRRGGCRRFGSCRCGW